MRMMIMAAAAASLAIAASPVLADPPSWAPAHGKRAHDRERLYDAEGRYYQPRRISRDDYVWRGKDGRYYCRRDNGTTGLLIGAGVGALAGHELAGRRDKTLGTILGAVGGGLLGRAIDKGDLRCR